MMMKRVRFCNPIATDSSTNDDTDNGHESASSAPSSPQLLILLLDESDCAALWYSREEIRAFRAETKKANRQRQDPSVSSAFLGNNARMITSADCRSGLEQYSSVNTVHRRHETRTVRRHHVRNVLQLQDEGYKTSTTNSSSVMGTDLAFLAGQSSQDSVQRAILYGIRDFVEALLVYQDDSSSSGEHEDFFLKPMDEDYRYLRAAAGHRFSRSSEQWRQEQQQGVTAAARTA